MKKVYITPCTDCYIIATTTPLLAGSNTSVEVMPDDYDPNDMIDLAPSLPDIPDFL